jgi:predicted transcriptional regulator
MSTMTFGPFKFVERLEKAGLSREQASAIVEAQKDSLSEVLDSTLATQSGLREIRSEMQAVKNNISLLDAKVDAKFDKLSWMMGILMAIAIANFAKQYF